MFQTKIWKICKQHTENQQQMLKALSPKKKGRCGRKKRIIPLDEIQALPVKKRRTVRAFARNSNIPKSTLQDRTRLTNSLKPLLTRDNEIHRLCFCISVINFNSCDQNINDLSFFGAIDSLRQEETPAY